MSDVRLEPRRISGQEILAVLAEMIEVGNAHKLQLLLDEHLATSRGGVVLDLSATTFISSSGVGVIAHLIRRTQDTGRTLCLVSPNASIHQLFRVTRLLTFDHVHLDETVDLAIARLAPTVA